ncbi:hypothetical protein [Streptomyces sp. NPDC046887]|uniref:hypothetical protein n=1 Tax=Streptomyces sp. NPDC046887 TaxID=3155472 RepID=UPI0033CBF21E
MTRIGQTRMLLHGGDREEARNRFAALWRQIGEHGAPLHRCTLAHYMADAQDDPGDELAWDLRALTAAESAADDGLGGGWVGASTAAGDGPGTEGGSAAGDGSAAALRALYPALQLNLAADYAKLHRPDAARAHLARARATAEDLAEDGYGTGVRAAIARLERRLHGG